VDSSGYVYVADSGNYRIEKTSNTGRFIKTWGNDFNHPGTKPGEFNNAYGVAVDKSGNVFVTDDYDNRIQEFTNTGKFIKAWGSKGTANGQFKAPAGVAVDSSGNVFVADMSNHRIQKFQLATPCPKGVTEITSGVCFIKKWGTRGSADGQLLNPLGVAVDSSDNVFVGDTGNNRIQKFDNDGKFITKWGSLGTGERQFHGPSDVAVDKKSGNVFVADVANNRIQKFNNDGKFILMWGSEGSGEGQFRFEFGISVDSSGNVYASEYSNNRVQRFTNTGDFFTKWGTKGP